MPGAPVRSTPLGMRALRRAYRPASFRHATTWADRLSQRQEGRNTMAGSTRVAFKLCRADAGSTGGLISQTAKGANLCQLAMDFTISQRPSGAELSSTSSIGGTAAHLAQLLLGGVDARDIPECHRGRGGLGPCRLLPAARRDQRRSCPQQGRVYTAKRGGLSFGWRPSSAQTSLGTRARTLGAGRSKMPPAVVPHCNGHRPSRQSMRQAVTTVVQSCWHKDWERAIEAVLHAHLLPALELRALRIRKKMGRHGIHSANAVPNICQMAPVSVARTAPNSTPACRTCTPLGQGQT